jgi:hypothetical protein
MDSLSAFTVISRCTFCINEEADTLDEHKNPRIAI